MLQETGYCTDPVELAATEVIPVNCKECKKSFPQFSQLFDGHTVPGNCVATGIPLQLATCGKKG